MKFFRIDLLTLLISLFILGSCKNPDNIGLPVDPSTALQTNLIDTTTINTVTERDSTVQTTGLAKTPLGYFKDPIFGTTEANIAAALNLPLLSAYTLPTGTITIDSVVLAMPYADGFYGDSLTTNYKVNVYQLNEPVVTTKTYYNTKAWGHETSLLGTKTFIPRPKTGFKITDIVTGAPDTQLHVSPQLRVKIDPGFITTKFFGASASQLTTNSVFQNYIKGLYITLDKTLPGSGGNMFFAIGGGAGHDTSRIEVYYKANNAGVIDTTKLILPLGSPNVAQIVHDYSSGASLLNTQINAPRTLNASYNTLYLQGLGGLRARISFPYLKKMLAAQQAVGNDLVINRAELVVTPVAGTGVPPFLPTPRLTLYRNDIALQRQLVPDASASDLHFIAVGSFGGFYDSSHLSYSYVITGYIEELMRGKLVDYGTFIAPTDTAGTASGNATVNYLPEADVAARSVVGGNGTSPYRMKLNIIYNKVSK